MSRRILFLFVIFSMLANFSDSAVAQPKKGNIDFIVIVDLSKSMIGGGGTANIFSRVQKTCKDLVKESQSGDTVTLITFGESVRNYPTVSLHDEQDRQGLYRIVEDFRANQQWTFTAAALKAGLDEAERLKAIFPNHRKIIYILTDGLNDPPPGTAGRGLTLAEIAKQYVGKPWYVFQVQYGLKIDKELEETAKKVGAPGSGTIDDKGAEKGVTALREPVKEARKAEITWVKVETKEIHVVLKEPGKPVEAKISLSLSDMLDPSNVKAELIRPDIPGDIELQNEIVSTSGETLSLRITARATQSTPNRISVGRIKIGLKEEKKDLSLAPLEVGLKIETAMIPPVWPYWLGGIASLLALAGAILWIMKKMRESRLLGTLQFWPKGKMSDKKTIEDLSALGRSAVIGSNQISAGHEPLANLTAKKIEDAYLVVVTAIEGQSKITFQGRQRDELILYNGDEFSIGNYDFRYTGATGRRPKM